MQEQCYDLERKYSEKCGLVSAFEKEVFITKVCTFLICTKIQLIKKINKILEFVG